MGQGSPGLCQVQRHEAEGWSRELQGAGAQLEDPVSEVEGEARDTGEGWTPGAMNTYPL